MKCIVNIYKDNGEKICEIDATTNLDNTIINKNKIIFKECSLDVIEFNRIYGIYRDVSRDI